MKPCKICFPRVTDSLKKNQTPHHLHLALSLRRKDRFTQSQLLHKEKVLNNVDPSRFALRTADVKTPSMVHCQYELKRGIKLLGNRINKREARAGIHPHTRTRACACASRQAEEHWTKPCP